MYEGLEKLAVKVKQLKRATDALEKNVRIMRKRGLRFEFSGSRNKGIGKWLETLGVKKPGGEVEATIRFPKIKGKITGMSSAPIATLNRASIEQAAKSHTSKEDRAILRAVRRLLPGKKDAVILEGTEPALALSKELGAPIRNPRAREIINRSALLHEGVEARQSGKAISPFFGHANVYPVLNDNNIMATATGPGSKEAKKFLREMREDEFGHLEEAGLGRLGLGTHRVSRHAKPHIQQIVNDYAKRTQEESNKL